MTDTEHPDWLSDQYTCEKGHVTHRHHLADESIWAGVVVCSSCGSTKTRLTARNLPFVPRVLVVVKPERTPPAMLKSLPDGPHFAHDRAYARGTYGEVFK